MSRHTILASAAALALLTASVAYPAVSPFRKMVSIEQAVEARVADVSLPVNDTGALRVTPCKGCKVLDLRASPATRYTVGSRTVSLAELRSTLARHSDAVVLVFYGTRTLALNRIRVELPRDAAR